MICPACNQENQEGTAFCANCGASLAQTPPVQQQPSVYQQPIQPPPVAQNPYATENGKLFSILAYIPFLWLIGLLVEPEKSDAKVRFHVGQGIILTIVGAALSIASSILFGILGNIFRTEISYWGVRSGVYIPAGWVSGLSMLVGLAISGVCLVLLILGCINASKGEQKQLPIIGNFAFIK